MIKISLKRKIKDLLNRSLAIKLIVVLLLECAWPTTTLALTGGPSQPEVQSFEPIGVSDMVDLFTGDFSYNIPLLEIEGYPMNISYHSGITMDQEASWVGLGWNVNPGVINRAMRGLPDDFNGDNVIKEQNVKKNQTVGISAAFAGELFGYDFASFNARLGIKYNNYTGVGIEKSFNVAISASNKYGGTGTIGLGITSSSDDGLSLSPSVSLGAKTSKTEKNDKVGVSVGASFNSRGGLTALTIAPDVTQSFGSDSRAGKSAAGDIAGKASAKFDFGQQTYSPSLDFPMENLSVTANFKLGLEAWGFAGSIAPGGYYAEQGQLTKIINSPAYGYMNAHNGQNNNSAMMDFNREKDGSFNKSTYNLPITNLTYDLYSVSAQGTGGSYRPFRSDVGHVFDIESYSTSDGYSGSFELGAGGIFKGGVDMTVNSANSHSGDWNSSKAAENMRFQSGGANVDYEPWYFKEANERSVNSDPGFLGRYGGFSAVRFALDGSTEFDAVTTGKIRTVGGAETETKLTDQRKARDKRNQTITTLTNREVYEGMGLFGSNATTTGIINSFVATNINKIGHHIGQITAINTDGRRYVYGLPAYNKEQQEVTFAVGKPVGGGSARTSALGEVTYVPGLDNSIGNKMGLDNYYSNTKMPPFAHAYLLSAVLSSDYVDVTGNGPSDDDLGNYVLFNYAEKTPNYKWRTPVKQNKAKFNQGLLADVNDDKGSYVYGVKQLYYLEKITTKNQLAEFVTSARVDGKGVTSENGGINNNSNQYQLDKIVLKSKSSGSVIKTVNFKYKSSGMLCQGVHNGTTGKLTLEELFFTYQNSDKGAYNSYKFSYNETQIATDNPNYSPDSYDRWGNYKSVNPGNIPFDYYPYTNQYYSTASTVHQDASVWNLKEIKLPSGGKIKIEYESDDYAYVQDKQAAQMYTYQLGVTTTPTSPVDLKDSSGFYFKIPSDAPGYPNFVNILDFIPDNRMVFFKFKMQLSNGADDYVPGYAEVDLSNLTNNAAKTRITMAGGVPYGRIGFITANTKDNGGGTSIHPAVKASLAFGRLNTPRIIWDQPNASAGINTQIVDALVNSSFFSTIQQAVQGPDEYLYTTKSKAKKVYLTNSWIKLKNVTGRKYGGGCRVKKVLLNDDFNTMTANAEETSEYGQVYTYTTTDAKGRVISSGVASYEPQVGGEENALKEPFFTETKKLLAPDDEHYTEAPFGESFYPSASVGYSKVRVENYYPDKTTLPAPWTGSPFENKKTGYVINEFYTAKDFPTITERTELEAIEHKTDPFSLASIFNINTKNHMTASQGFYVELNDMHGKPKATKTYNNRRELISSIEYFYKSKPWGGSGSRRLTNTVQMIAPNGSLMSGEIGVFFDAVGDLREQTTESTSSGININTDIIEAVVPIITVVPIPSYTSDKTQFRSAVITKVVQRFGIIDKTIAKQDGSTVTSSDLAYDSESGDVLLTQTANNFNDIVYTFKYPAYWYYKGMGAAYKNIDYAQTVTLAAGKATLPKGTNLFSPGDEVEIIDIPTVQGQQIAYTKAWITKSKGEKIELQTINGSVPSNGTFRIKVIRSGYRNMQTMEMANLTSMVNPIGGLRSNVYQRIINSSAIEYKDEWDINCDCLVPGSIVSANPYVIGTLGNWRVKSSYAFVAPRLQTNSNSNSNLRVDGFYANFSPFYKNNGGRWSPNPYGWVAASEITNVSTEGRELESRDALGRYSSASYDFNQSVATAVAANSEYNEHGFESFENNSSSCSPDKHFRFGTIANSYLIQSSYSGPPYTAANVHTGKNSILVHYQASQVLNISGEYGISSPISLDCTKPAKCPGKIIYMSGFFKVINGEGPYTLTINKISGDGTITMAPDGVSFIVQPQNQSYKAHIALTDEKGCIYTKLVQAPFNQ